MSYLVEAIEVLTLSPGRYQEFLPPIEDIVESLLQDKTALAQIIEVILEQVSCHNASFCACILPVPTNQTV